MTRVSDSGNHFKNTDTYLFEQKTICLDWQIKLEVCMLPGHHGFNEVDGLIAEAKPILNRAVFEGTAGFEYAADYVNILNNSNMLNHTSYLITHTGVCHSLKDSNKEKDWKAPISGIQECLCISFEHLNEQEQPEILEGVFRGSISPEEPSE